MAVAHEVLTAEQHLKGRFRAVALDGAQALPRVLIEKAQTGIERGASPRLQRPVADGIHLLEDGEHVPNLHAGSPQRLVGVSQRRIGNVDGPHARSLSVREYVK